jgi:hypothetical protein
VNQASGDIGQEANEPHDNDDRENGSKDDNHVKASFKVCVNRASHRMVSRDALHSGANLVIRVIVPIEACG